ncbi:acyltransferase family protein [Azotobacter bryophylli]|uniref:Acyltransferase family protein n=1 Tax=Azotobacter bryophylli TaxID=1986537 RepID=A0ABV7ARR6_9GAMM
MRFEGADGIRGLACLIVLCTHAVAMFFNSTYMALAGMGKVGVWLFFVLSAFLLTSKFDKFGFDSFQIFSYALGRCLRIIPLFALVLCLYYLLGTAGVSNAKDLLDAITLSYGYAHLWTIPVEFKFYLILPFIAFLFVFIRNKYGNFAVFVFSFTFVLVQQCVRPYYDTPENSISTSWYLSSFTIGCYCAVSIDFFRGYISARMASVIGIFVIFAMVCVSPVVRNIVFDMPLDKWTQDKHVFISAVWGLFVVALVDGKGFLGCLLKSKIMVKMGMFSYSVYLVHWYFYVSLANKYPDSYFWMIVGFFSSIIFGGLLYYAVEAPLERLRHSIQIKIRPL